MTSTSERKSIAPDFTPDEWWVSTFGKEEKIKRETFMEKFQNKVKTTDAYTVRVLTQYVIRGFEPDDGNVLSREFAYFVQRFGPLDSSFTRAKASLFDKDNYLMPWFHGALTRNEAENRLKEQSKDDSGGTGGGWFLVRFSEKYPEKLTIMYTSARDAAIKNILVHNTEKGFKLHLDGGEADASSPNEKCYPNLIELIESFKAKLVRPVVSPILHHIKDHDAPGGKSHASLGFLPDFYKSKEQRYNTFVEGGRGVGSSSSASAAGSASPEAKKKYQKMTSPPSPARRPSTGGHEAGTTERRPSTGGHDSGKHVAGYVRFPDGSDRNHLAAPAPK